MVTPHPVGAPYPIQLFSHLAYVFDRSASLPKFFLQHQSFRSKCSDICYTPISHNLQTGVLLHLQVFPAQAIHKESLSWSSTSDSQAIPHTQHIFSPLTFSFCFSFCFHFLAVSCITFPVDVSKNDCSDSLPDWKWISLPFVWYLFCRPFLQVGVISRLTMHPIILSSLAAFFNK